MNRRLLVRASSYALALVGLGLLARAHGVAHQDSEDLKVYWRAAQDFVQGTFIYIVRPELKGMVFKYPPWIIPWVLPFAALSWPVTQSLWFVLEIGALASCLLWLVRVGCSPGAAGWVAVAFWWIWRAHLEMGQLTLVLLAAALWLQPKTPLRTAGAGYLLSAKLFSGIAILGAPRSQLLNPKTWLAGLSLVAGSFVLVLLLRPEPGAWGYLQGWAHAASSGGAALGAQVIRGQQNHALTTRILDALGVAADNTRADVGVCLLLIALLAPLWMRFSKGLSDAERWAGWLALGMVVHPLAWDHSYVMAYPLAALAVDRSFTRKRGRELAVLGVILTAVLTPQLVGAWFVKPFELLACKFWGVVASAAGLVVSAKSARRLT